LTIDDIRKTALAAAVIIGAFFAAQGADLPTREITSNNIYGFAGNGDTLWMVTDQGVNYTIAKSATLAWLGYLAPLRVLAMGFGGGTAVMCLDTADTTIAKIWFYSHTGSSYDSIWLPFATNSLDATVRKNTVFKGVGVTYGGGAFWMACMDGGLVRWNPSGKAMQAFFPGKRRAFEPASVRFDSTQGFTMVPDSTKQVIAVGAQDKGDEFSSVLVLTPAALYRFSPGDSLWDTLSSNLSDSTKIFEKYLSLFSGRRSPLLYATIVTKAGEGDFDTSVYRFDFAKSKWTTFNFLKGVSALTFGPDSIAYLVVNPNHIQAVSGNRADTLIRSGNDTLICSQASFTERIENGSNNITPTTINDVFYLPSSDTSGALWIATSSPGVVNNGLFFTRDERKDERGKAPFSYVHRERKIGGGLKETYAYPGILNGNRDFSGQTQALFAYSLSKKSKVSIAVYDWNMELVKNVITGEERAAGKDDPLGNGRSTDKKRDFWDGTNNAGRRVAVGVYYFRITADNGERSFGKIIVAK
jgi:hypothetical protein